MFNTKFIIALLIACFVFPAYAATKSPWSWKGYALGEAVDNMHGGIKTGTIATAAGLLTATFDTEIANWWKGGQFAFGVLGIAQTHNQNLYTGALQTPSNFSAVSEIRINDLSYQHTFSDSIMIRAGIMDMDDWFNINEVASNLINAAFDNTIAMSANAQLTTYPYPGFGALAQLGGNKFGLLLGIFQGNPDHQDTVFEHGQLFIAEASTHFGGSGKTDLQFTLKGGLWDYQQNLSYIGTTDRGLYVIGEATWQTISGKNLGTSVEFGINPKKFATVTDSLAISFTIGGLFDCRPNDSLNLGIGRVWENGEPNFETFFEVGYTIQLIDNLDLTPDLQYFIHPGGQYNNAWVGILRLVYTIPE